MLLQGPYWHPLTGISRCRLLPRFHNRRVQRHSCKGVTPQPVAGEAFSRGFSLWAARIGHPVFGHRLICSSSYRNPLPDVKGHFTQWAEKRIALRFVTSRRVGTSDCDVTMIKPRYATPNYVTPHRTLHPHCIIAFHAGLLINLKMVKGPHSRVMGSTTHSTPKRRSYE
ncbi:hypothetical protein PaecuDRAFT_0116 [Paenibacillus curdlanolyticus YK9]|uniref:Uncharacterized protein n=1 Tax=Paenibacillus curdlanolyticus YK9 TaxID=717606 RepID=E0I4S4_9BACL|nr:hypothetical protein PaecuDRAFT_0116 [Paenibacillus curdlanolyticus YK9]